MSRFEQSKIDKYNDICNTPKISAQQLVDKILDGAFDLVDLTKLEDPKKSTVEKSVNEARAQLPNEQEQTDWNAIDLANNDLRTNIHLLDAYIKKWSNTRPAQNHVDEAESQLSKLMSAEWNEIVDIATQHKTEPTNWKEILFDYIVVYEKDYSQKQNVDSASSYLKDTINKEYNQIIHDSTLTYPDKIAALNNFVNNNTKYPVSAEYVLLVQNEISKLKRNIEERQWFIVDKNDYESLKYYLDKTPDSAFLSDIDNAMWEIASLRGTDYIRRYTLDMPEGKHIDKAKSRLEHVNEWENIERNADIFELSDYIQKKKYSPYCRNAEDLLSTLRKQKIDEYKSKKWELNYETDLKPYCDKKIITFDEFVDCGIAHSNSLQSSQDKKDQLNKLLGDSDIVETLETAATAFANNSIPSDNNDTDILLFGVPSSGKTCITLGLVSAKNIIIDDGVTKRRGYADMLRLACSINYPFQPTGTQDGTFLTHCIVNNQQNKTKHHINLIDMAGEVIAKKIAEGDENTSLGDISHIEKILESKNSKAIFFVINPIIKDNWNHINQQSVISRILTLLREESSKEKSKVTNILDKIISVHFIVSHADLLGETQQDRFDRAEKIIWDNYSPVIEQLTQMSKDSNSGINASTNYCPKLFTFSLGDFYTGSVFDYNEADSTNLIHAFMDTTRARRNITQWDKVKSFLNS